MDLTTAAQILVDGQTPTLDSLQEQEFNQVRSEFKDAHPTVFFPNGRILRKRLSESP